MAREHECECNESGCQCIALIACTPGADWCDDCDEGRHIGARWRDAAADAAADEAEARWSEPLP